MFGIRVRSHGPARPAQAAGGPHIGGTDIGPALVPIPAVSFQAWQSRGQIHGAPGTQRIPAPAPFPGYDRELTTFATEGVIGMPSSMIPFWFPQLWYQTDIPAVIPVQKINSTHELPVPAIRPNVIMVTRATNSPGGIGTQSGAFAARLGGRWPIGWPRVLANYPETRGLGLKDYG
jgi:hypothetical protein